MGKGFGRNDSEFYCLDYQFNKSYFSLQFGFLVCHDDSDWFDVGFVWIWIYVDLSRNLKFGETTILNCPQRAYHVVMT